MTILALALASACARSPATPTVPSGDELTANLTACANVINQLRASIRLPALVRSASLESFAADAASEDGQVHVAHQHFAATNGGGTAMAETEILWWTGLTVRSVIDEGLAQMWAAGPAGEHYGIIAGPYTQVGCGLFVNSNGEVTVTQDFR